MSAHTFKVVLENDADRHDVANAILMVRGVELVRDFDDHDATNERTALLEARLAEVIRVSRAWENMFGRVHMEVKQLAKEMGE